MNVQGQAVVVQGVGLVSYPPVRLDRWPSEDRSICLVSITRNIDAEKIRGLFAVVMGPGAPS